jgi:hypothetical protein
VRTPNLHRRETDEWEDLPYLFPGGMPNPSEVMTIADGREVEIISAGVIDLKPFTWAKELAPTAA